MTAPHATGTAHRRSNLLTFVMLLFLLYAFFPLLWLVVSSTKTESDLFSTFGLWFGHRFALFANIRQTLAYGHGEYLRWLANTFVYSVTSALGAAFLATFGGYGFAKYVLPRRRGLLGTVPRTVLAGHRSPRPARANNRSRPKTRPPSR